MKKQLCALMGVLLFFNINLTYAQSIANVSLYTGTSTVGIPLYTVVSGGVTLPISLSYASNGVKVKDAEGTAGMGWNLQAGGKISRLVRGLPDDCLKDTAGNSRLGWMSTSNTAANQIAGFTIKNIGDGNCSNDTADVDYINNKFHYNEDTDPDIFYVNATGLSCQLVYDRSTSKFQPLVYQDIVVTYTKDSTSGLITSFTIVNDKGTKYVFAAPDSTTQTAVAAGGTHTYFSTPYKQYQHGITFFSAWSLTSITDASGNSVNLNYTYAATKRNSSDSLTLYLPNSTTTSYQYSIVQSIRPETVQTISTSDNNTSSPVTRLTFNWQDCDAFNQTGQTILTNIAGYGRVTRLTYSNVTISTNPNSFSRSFLRSLADDGCNTPISYKFAYGGETFTSGVWTTVVPDSASNRIDYWGFPAYNTNTSLQPKVLINPSNASYTRYVIYNSATSGGSYSYSTTNGYDRSAGSANYNGGSLISITNAQGGTTTISYEPNFYVDVPSGQTIKGGGIRVNQITDYDGIDTTKNIVRNYSYNDPSTSTTSGKPITLPLYAFDIPYSGSAGGQTLWDDVTILSKNDLSSEDHSIVYGYVKMSMTNAGSTRYHFTNTATNWDSNVVAICTGCSTVEWNPTVNLSSRTNCALTYGPVKNDIYSYPFLPNTNFDFERGLPISVTNFNSSNTEVSETDYTYQQYSGPTHLSTVTGFHFDNNPSGSLTVVGYNKYTTYFDAGELQATVTNKVYDSPTLTQSRSTVSTYTYGSSNHELPTAIAVTNSDNSTNTTNITYTKDIPATAPSTDSVTNALYNLRLLNINIPVETYQQVTRSGTTLTVGASLTLFKEFTVGAVNNYLAWQQYKMVTPDGGSFSPFTLISSPPSYSKDSKYFQVANFDKYDNTGFPITVDDANKHYQTTIPDHNVNQVTASFSNAQYNELAFINFDTKFAPPAITFSISGTGSAATGSHSGKAYGLNTGQTVSATVVKNSTASNYILSMWINAPSGSKSLNITINGSSQPAFSYTGTGTWQYYEKKIPVSSFTSPLAFSFTTSQNISIDDILLYPDVAEATTAGYDTVSYAKTVSTTTNGVSAYYTNDTWGRLLYQYDRDKNIFEKRTYVTASQISTGLSAGFNITNTHSAIVKNYPLTFTGPNVNCTVGVTYTWDFGDGTVISGVNLTSLAHTFTTANTFTVKLTMSNPILGSSTYSQPVVVLSQPPALVPHTCPVGVSSWDNCHDRAASLFNSTCPAGGGGDNTHSSFNIYQVDYSDFYTVHYQWQKSTDGGATWTNIGTDYPIWTSPSYSGVHQNPYEVQCIVSSSGQSSGNSGTVSILTVCLP